VPLTPPSVSGFAQISVVDPIPLWSEGYLDIHPFYSGEGNHHLFNKLINFEMNLNDSDRMEKLISVCKGLK
jgi:hypothetical protein